MTGVKGINLAGHCLIVADDAQDYADGGWSKRTSPRLLASQLVRGGAFSVDEASNIPRAIYRGYP